MSISVTVRPKPNNDNLVAVPSDYQQWHSQDSEDTWAQHGTLTLWEFFCTEVSRGGWRHAPREF